MSKEDDSNNSQRFSTTKKTLIAISVLCIASLCISTVMHRSTEIKMEDKNTKQGQKQHLDSSQNKDNENDKYVTTTVFYKQQIPESEPENIVVPLASEEEELIINTFKEQFDLQVDSIKANKKQTVVTSIWFSGRPADFAKNKDVRIGGGNGNLIFKSIDLFLTYYPANYIFCLICDNLTIYKNRSQFDILLQKYGNRFRIIELSKFVDNVYTFTQDPNHIQIINRLANCAVLGGPHVTSDQFRKITPFAINHAEWRQTRFVYLDVDDFELFCCFPLIKDRELYYRKTGKGNIKQNEDEVIYCDCFDYYNEFMCGEIGNNLSNEITKILVNGEADPNNEFSTKNGSNNIYTLETGVEFDDKILLFLSGLNEEMEELTSLFIEFFKRMTAEYLDIEEFKKAMEQVHGQQRLFMYGHFEQNIKYLIMDKFSPFGVDILYSRLLPSRKAIITAANEWVTKGEFELGKTCKSEIFSTTSKFLAGKDNAQYDKNVEMFVKPLLEKLQDSLFADVFAMTENTMFSALSLQITRMCNDPSYWREFYEKLYSNKATSLKFFESLAWREWQNEEFYFTMFDVLKENDKYDHVNEILNHLREYIEKFKHMKDVTTTVEFIIKCSEKHRENNQSD